MNAANSPALPSTGPADGRQGALGTRPRALTLVQLVFESSDIIVGAVESTAADGGAPIVIAVERSFPSGRPPQVRVSLTSTGMGARVSFAPSERVLLFLETVQANEAVLFGNDDVGKWPRQRPDWRFTAGHVRPLAELVRVIELLFRVDASRSLDARARILVDEIVPAGSLGEIAAAEYAADAERWTNMDPDGALSWSQVKLLVAATLLLQGRPMDPAADYAVLQLLVDAPTSIGVPRLIERLDDPDAAARDTAFSSLQTLALPFTSEQFGYSANQPGSERAAAVRGWRDWWAAQAPAHLREQVPRLLIDLDAPALLRRELGDAGLRLISGRETGYHPGDAPDRRTEAVRRWRQWWDTYVEKLK